MTETVAHWARAAQLSGPATAMDRVSRSYDRAARSGVLCIADEDATAAPGALFGPDPGPARIITRTGGTTGQPRRVIRTQHSWTASFAVIAARLGVTSQDRYAVPGDLSHSLSFYALAEALYLGASVSLPDHPTPRSTGQMLARETPSILYITPTQLRALDLGLPETERFASVRQIMVGGGPFDGRAGAAALRRFPNAQTHLFYGTSETSFLTLGTDPFPHVDLRIDAPPGAVGPVWVGGPYLASCYAQGDAAGDAQPARDTAGRICLGELGQRDTDGAVRLRGRGEQMITVADRNVFPEAVESWLLEQDGVAHAAVIARPDRLRGHRLEVAICGTSLDLSKLRAATRAALGPHATPARFLQVPDWPILPSGKPDLAQLRARLDST